MSFNGNGRLKSMVPTTSFGRLHFPRLSFSPLLMHHAFVNAKMTAAVGTCSSTAQKIIAAAGARWIPVEIAPKPAAITHAFKPDDPDPLLNLLACHSAQPTSYPPVFYGVCVT